MEHVLVALTIHHTNACCVYCGQDQRLIFRLKKQQFIEQLRLGTTQADKSALGR